MHNGLDDGQKNGSSTNLPSYYPDVADIEELLRMAELNGNDVAVTQIAPSKSDEQVLEELREILVAPEQTEIEQLRGDVNTLRAWADDDRLFEKMTPLVNRAITRQVQEKPQEVIELFYPLIGGMVNRAVKEAIHNLVDRIDAKRREMQSFFSGGRLNRDSKPDVGNGSTATASDIFRDSLPFTVEELFVIHTETGLLLHHESLHPEASHDSDIVGAMLTAIGDFVQDAFGAKADGKLQEIEYGDKRILLEDFRHVYVAAVVDGIESFEYRHEIRSRISHFEIENRDELASYGGDTSQLKIRHDLMRELLYLTDATTI